LGHEGTDWLSLEGEEGFVSWVVVWVVGSGNWLMSRERDEVSLGEWLWGSGVVAVVISMVCWGWVMSKSGLGSGSVTGGGVWSSGGWVGVVVRDISWLVLETWGTSWSILWSVGS